MGSNDAKQLRPGFSGPGRYRMNRSKNRSGARRHRSGSPVSARVQILVLIAQPEYFEQPFPSSAEAAPVH